jgi:hypothetical protein
VTALPSAERQLGQAIHAAKPWILPAAIVGAGLVGLTVVSHGRGAAALVGQTRSSAMVEAIAPASSESAPGAMAPSIAPPAAVLSDVRCRFGFLELEDAADASAR